MIMWNDEDPSCLVGVVGSSHLYIQNTISTKTFSMLRKKKRVCSVGNYISTFQDKSNHIILNIQTDISKVVCSEISKL
jgi:hypothetical protein